MTQTNNRHDRSGRSASAEAAAPLGNARTPNRAIFDPQLAVRRSMNRPEILAKMIDYFQSEAQEVFPQMQAALDEGDLTLVGRLGHRLKGTVAYLGAEQAQSAAATVERFQYEPGSAAEAAAAVRTLQDACAQLQAAVAGYVAAAGDPS